MIEPPVRPTRSGAHRSLEILHELAGVRHRAFGAQRASRAVGELAWTNAQAYAIQRDDFRSVWHAGHVTALLSNGVDVIAASQTGGLWLLKRTDVPTALAGYTGTPLGDAWDAPDVACLAWGAGPGQVYAGCTGGGVLVLLELETVFGGGLVPKRTTILPVPFSRAANLVVLREPNRLVVSTGKIGGVWWSPIPEPASNLAGYDWQPALGLDGFADYDSLAAGPGASVAVVKAGGRSLGIGLPPPGASIFRGTFEAAGLVFTEAHVEGVEPGAMQRTSIASCADQPARMYAVSAGLDGMILAVLASDDGGATWRARATPDRAKAGLRGFYNNCIAVSPQRPDLVVVGWLSGGPFWSENGAESWAQPHEAQSVPHLHNDLHALVLGRNPHGPEPLFVGGDGGIVVTRDLGRTYHSQFNRSLNNLQFYGGARPSFVGTYGGSLTASSRYPGLLAGGTQDNGNVYRLPDVHRDGVPRQADNPWFRLVGGDGDLNRFVDPLGVLLSFNNGNVKLSMALWNEETRRFGDLATIPGNDAAGGVAPTAVELVQAPAWRRDGKRMFAAVGTKEGAVYGFFASDPAKELPEASNAELVRLGEVQGLVTAIASRDGASLMVGTDSGRIFTLDSASGAVSELALPEVEGVTGAVVSRLEIFPTPVLAGTLPDNAFALVGDRILHFNGLFWATTNGTDWLTFALDEQTGRLFAASDGDVFVSQDWGKTWLDASLGLPARPHCADLRIASDGRGGRDLYLATYGRSAWRATIARRSEVFELPPQAVEVLVGVIEDGGGLVRRGKRFFKVPPRPLIRDILAALIAEDVASSMSEDAAKSSREIRRAALREIADLALRAAERLG